MTIRFENSYAQAVPGVSLRLDPDVAPAPRLLKLNEGLLAELGLTMTPEQATQWLSGAVVPEGSEPVALAYAGHQFGGFSPRLGDGRAHLLGEIIGRDGLRRDLQLKGSGRTPFSRGGDGKAAVGPMLREYLISEAMHALGIPTTRSLAVVATGERVWREAGGLPGAVLARVAASHIRVGTFQYFAHRRDTPGVGDLIHYTIDRHYPEDVGAMPPGLALFDAVAARQARLIAQWMGVGFIHGVMNTDNMALSGETIDYGPCAFMEDYAPGTVFSSIDQTGRYAYANQPLILGWNLARLAESMLLYIDPSPERAIEIANARLAGIEWLYHQEWLTVMRAKLGLAGEEASDGTLANDLLGLMVGLDWTTTFRKLTRAAEGDASGLPVQISGAAEWMEHWRRRLAPNAAATMRRANPAVIPRNHLVEAALNAATEGDMAPFEGLLAAVCDPYAPEAGREAFALPAPTGFGPYVTFCGT